MTTPGIKELRKSLEQVLKKALAEDNKPSRTFTTLENVIFGADKKTDFKNYDGGAVVQAIAQDLEEFGQKGVQGVRVADDTRFVGYHRARKDLKAPYLQAGVLKGSLVLVLRDEEANVEDMHVLVKDYVQLKAKLKKSSASVTNIEPDDEGGTIARSVQNTARKLGTTVDQDPNYGEITGNIVLTAHGRPATMPSGRVVADELGEKTPAEIFKLLTSEKDPAKRVGKDYNGTLTLCGCFTASGGPEAEKQDDPYAKKVLDLFRKKGYKKISVVGYPGATITASRAGTDTHGTPVEEGDEKVLARPATGAELARQEKLEAEAEKAIKAYDKLVTPHDDALDKKRDARNALQQAIADSGVSQKEYLQTKAGKAGVKTVREADAAFDKLKKAVQQAKAKRDEAQKALKDSGLEDTWARLEGRFGLRVVN